MQESGDFRYGLLRDQYLGLHPNQDYRTGAIVTRSHQLNRVETLDKWNKYEIRYEKDRIQAWINGIKTADINDSLLSAGNIALQAAENGEIKFRNVKVQPLELSRNQ